MMLRNEPRSHGRISRIPECSKLGYMMAIIESLRIATANVKRQLTSEQFFKIRKRNREKIQVLGKQNISLWCEEGVQKIKKNTGKGRERVHVCRLW